MRTSSQSIRVAIRVISRSLSIFFNTSFRSTACSAYFCWATLSDWSTASTLRVSRSSSEAARREVWCLIRSADPSHQRCPLAPVSLTASSRRLSVESEQISDWHLESSSHALELFKRGSIPSPLNQAKKIHRHPYHLGKVFLTLPEIMPDLEESKAELLSEAVQN